MTAIKKQLVPGAKNPRHNPELDFLSRMNNLANELSELKVLILQQQRLVAKMHEMIHKTSMTDHYNLFNQKELAKRINAHPNTVANMIQEGLEFIDNGTKRKIPWINYVQFIEKHKRKYGRFYDDLQQ